MDIFAYVFLVLLAMYGVFGLVFPGKLMGRGSGRDSWIPGEALYKTPGRTRFTCAFLLAFALFALAGKLSSAT